MFVTSNVGGSAVTTLKMFEAFLEFSKTLSEAIKDPSVLDDIVKKTYALSAEEISVAEKAKNDIDANNAVLAKIKEQQDALDLLVKQQADQKAENDAALIAIKKAQADIDSAKQTVEQQKIELQIKLQKASDDSSKISAKSLDLDEQEQALREKESALNDQENKLKERITKLREQTEGL